MEKLRLNKPKLNPCHAVISVSGWLDDCFVGNASTSEHQLFKKPPDSHTMLAGQRFMQIFSPPAVFVKI